MSDTSKPARATPLRPRRRAILIGASQGIGAALAKELAQAGYTLALLDRNAELLNKVCVDINAGGWSAVPYQHDVTETESVPSLLRRIVADLGGLDLFVYVAGVIHFPALDEYNFEQDRKMVEVNLLGAMAWHDATQIDPRLLRDLFAEVDDPALCAELLQLCRTVIEADRHVTDGEALMLSRAFVHWRGALGPAHPAARAG